MKQRSILDDNAQDQNMKFFKTSIDSTFRILQNKYDALTSFDFMYCT